MNTIKIENWNPESDTFLKKAEISIHNAYHEQLVKDYKTREDVLSVNRKLRIDALKVALKNIGKNFSGKVLEVGAGDGWCSAYIHSTFKVDHIHTMEINPPAVESLIPHVFNLFNVEKSKCTLVLGSFNDIRLKDHFDFVVAMGALHHSSNLYTTYKNIYQSLKPGGWLVAQEPAMSNMARNNYFISREMQTIKFKGLQEVKNSDRSDIFYRECEHRTAAFHAGFDFFSDKLDGQKKTTSWFSKAPAPESTVSPHNIVLYAQKPVDFVGVVPPTNWEESLINR